MAPIESSWAHYLPQHEGLLPKWLLLVSLISALNSVQAYVSLGPTRQVYGGPRSTGQITSLGARTFGTWTFLSAVIRFRAAYAIDQPEVYLLAFTTFAIAGAHFGSEWLAFRTVQTPWKRGGKGSVGPLCVASITGVWMWLCWGDYVR
ncbi:MAG: hypothetical protein M4579_003745 [Chaenotheca gracillima]|nr:MAG: hypothetical protein M4579_003745 [Chaenotheca gracillima]